MNLDELRAVQDREREKDSLQHLRDSFYEEVGSYIADLRAERERRADQAEDPFADPEVRRLTDEIETAEEVAESIYERRMGKVVKTASLSAAGYTADTEGLTGEEVDLFDDLVDRIEENQETVLDVLSGSGGGSADSDADRQRPDRDGRAHSAPEGAEPDSAGGSTPEGVGPPEIGSESGDGTDDATALEGDAEPLSDPPTPTEPVERSTSDSETDGPDAAASDATDGDRPPAEAAAIAADEDGAPALDGDGAASGEAPADGVDAAALMGDLDRVTVRITDDVGEIVGVDGTAYDLVSDDVVTLPEENAMPLLEKDAASRVE